MGARDDNGVRATALEPACYCRTLSLRCIPSVTMPAPTRRILSGGPPECAAQIWIPDITLYNSFTGLQTTLDPGSAGVSSDGSVFYSRPGTYEVLCKFSGLVAFPFDTLSCALEFGGWGLSGGHQGILLDGAGYEFSKQEATSGSSYQEYQIGALEEIRTYV